MSKFKKKSKADTNIPTAALPDIIFMLLFFFMVTTVLRETDILVKQNVPRVEELTKLEKKSLVSYIYIGEPKNPELYGTEARIQLNDVLADPSDVVLFVQQEKDKMNEAERDAIWIAMKVDVDTKMGIVSDVQQELREVNALKVLYTSVQRLDR
ncbi:ExbD/TolR family protein [Peijinzhouia sedimentorum]